MALFTIQNPGEVSHQPFCLPYQVRSATDEQHVRIMCFTRPSPQSHFKVGPRTHISLFLGPATNALLKVIDLRLVT